MFQPNEEMIGFVEAAWPPAERNPEPPVWEALAGDGSDRRFFRVRAGEETAVVVLGPDSAENRAYELIGRHLWRLGRLGPEFLAVDQARGLFLVEDLGSTLLQESAGSLVDPDREELYKKTVHLLADLHDRGGQGFEPSWCSQTARYDRSLILERETGYFMSAFIRGYLGMSGDDPGLTEEFETLAEAALKGTETVLMHRDFQSRNIMIKNGRPRLVDFQGARPGPPGYDLASLIYDPYVRLSDGLRADIPDWYVAARSSTSRFDPRNFRATLPHLAVCRLLQALGAYGHLSRVKGKTGFERYMPRALGSLGRLLDREPPVRLPKLRRLVSEAAGLTGLVS